LQWSIVGLLYWCGGTSVCSFCFSLLVLTIVLAVLNNRESQQFCPAASVRVALVDCWAVYWCCGTFVFIFGIFKVCAHCFFLGSVLHIVLIIFIAFSEQQDLSVFYSRHGQNGLHHRHGWQNLDAGRSSQGRYRLILVLFCGAVRNRIRFMLTDCPTFSATQFGYLSELLRWHASDEPSLDKFTRNDEACSQWQGNRNPFVDYPQLSQLFYPNGEDEVLPNSFTYIACSAPTTSPTGAHNSCATDLEAGNIPFFKSTVMTKIKFSFFPWSYDTFYWFDFSCIFRWHFFGSLFLV
jgi:hypothetical protein